MILDKGIKFIRVEWKYFLFVSIFCVASIGLFYTSSVFMGGRLYRGFKRVNSTTRESLIINTQNNGKITSLYLFNSKTGKNENIGPLFRGTFWLNYYYSIGKLAIYVLSSNRVYIASPTGIVFVVDAKTMNLLTKIDLNSYIKLGAFYPEFLYVFNDELWFSTFITQKSVQYVRPKFKVYKLSLSSLKCTDTNFSKPNFNNMTVKNDSLGHFFFLSHSGLLKTPRSSYDVTYDYTSSKGWLISWFEDDPIYSKPGLIECAKNCDYIVHDNNGEKVDVIKGYNAFWGFDGNIYFVRNGAELWCYSVNKRKAEIIYKPPSSEIWSERPILSRDRTFLALPCKKRNSKYYIIFDLREKECMETGNLMNFTWLSNK